MYLMCFLKIILLKPVSEIRKNFLIQGEGISEISEALPIPVLPFFRIKIYPVISFYVKKIDVQGKNYHSEIRRAFWND